MTLCEAALRFGRGAASLISRTGKIVHFAWRQLFGVRRQSEATTPLCEAAEPRGGRISSAAFRVVFGVLAFLSLQIAAFGQATSPKESGMRKASELIKKQQPPFIFQDVLARTTPENSHVVVSLTFQRMWLMADDETAIDSPISSGKRAGMTPTGEFAVRQKDPNHRSNVYGDFVDGNGRVVRAGVSMKIDAAPSGTHFIGAPMKWFCRITDEGVGMHIGILPGYAASHGCVRLPAEIAPMIYAKVKVGTPVEIVP
jgi:lipoprotein-anchoring transpeptidase ErfK/SrfK